MAEKRTDIVVLLDRSGSMNTGRSDHEGGLRSFVNDQKSLAGDVRFTLIQFDTQAHCDVVYDAVPIEQVEKIELIPRGGTPLLDAIFKATAHVQAKVPADANVLFMVITDGEENESREATKQQVQARVKDLEEKHGWRFIYLGANVDAFREAGQIGVVGVRAANYCQTDSGIAAAYDNLGGKAWTARKAAVMGVSLCNAKLDNTPIEREQLTSGVIVQSSSAAAKADFVANSTSTSQSEDK